MSRRDSGARLSYYASAWANKPIDQSIVVKPLGFISDARSGGYVTSMGKFVSLKTSEEAGLERMKVYSGTKSFFRSDDPLRRSMWSNEREEYERSRAGAVSDFEIRGGSGAGVWGWMGYPKIGGIAVE